MLREALGHWMNRCRLVPGNHDNPVKLRKAFPELLSESDRALTFELLAGGWRIVGLDSHVPGETKGCVSADQLAWLETRLASGRTTPTLIFVHHPPVPIHVAWLDDLGLDEASHLVELVETSPQVKAVCAGHVHQEFSGRIGAAAVYTTPSTCVQFGARTEKTFDTKMAGYRTFTLDGDRHQTEVYRLSASIKIPGL